MPPQEFDKLTPSELKKINLIFDIDLAKRGDELIKKVHAQIPL